MSAILGIYHPDGRPASALYLDRMIASLSHRGPDGSGTRVAGPAGLGHLRLFTTPESLRERLPYEDRTGELAITADARIDNREELISLLGLTGRPPEEIPDSELILAAYEEWGERSPARLLGDFAFCVWDRRKQSLFCARDHFGIKPFYYYSCDSLFAFASEIKALLCLPETPCRLNEGRVGEYLVDAMSDKENTFYSDILRLPPGHSLTVTREGVRLRSYYCLDPSRELRLNSDREYAEGFREVFEEAVRCRLRSAFPVGSFLSGGLDSSSVTCMARSLVSRSGKVPLETFSLVFDGIPQCDERPYINEVLAQNGLSPNYVRGDNLSPLADLDRVFWHEDEAFYGPNLFLHWALYDAVQKRGVRVILDGFDGDSTVSHGFLYLDELARAGKWLDLAIEARGLARYFNVSPWKLIGEYTYFYGLDPAVSKYGALRQGRRALRALRRRMPGRRRQAAGQAGWHAMLKPDFVERIELTGRRRVWWQASPSTAGTEREAHYRSLTQGIQPLALEVLDKASAAFSVESRHPFWDKRLVEFCLALPPEQKLRRGWSRMIMRRALSDILPHKVQWRASKTNFIPLLLNALLVQGREPLERAIFNDSGDITQYVNSAVLRKTYRRLVSRTSQDTAADLLALWRTVSLTLWLEYTWSGEKLTKEVIPM